MSHHNTVILGNSPTYFSVIISELRDKDVQLDRMRFRSNLRKFGQLLAYEISKELEYEERTVHTPLGESPALILKEQPVAICIMRAGLPLHDGFLEVFDHADNGFVGAFREESEEGDIEIKFEYMATPDLTNRIVVILDPMLATGRSLVQSYHSLLKKGKPRKVYIGCIIGSEKGVDYIQRNMPEATLFIGAVDAILNKKAYIVPGLGDAGDLAFGQKL
jgi:uracil phosphoribosyltransferase